MTFRFSKALQSSFSDLTGNFYSIGVKTVFKRIQLSLLPNFNPVCVFPEDYTDAAVALVNAVYSPYTPYLLDYSALQTGFLTENLNTVQLVWQNSFDWCLASFLTHFDLFLTLIINSFEPCYVYYLIKEAHLYRLS